MTYKWHKKDISFTMIWKGSNSMFHDMDGIKELIDEDAMSCVPKHATVFMFKVDKRGWCYLGAPYDEKLFCVRRFTHIGWKKFLSEEERLNALENIKWMYRVIPNHPGQSYII